VSGKVTARLGDVESNSACWSAVGGKLYAGNSDWLGCLSSGSSNDCTLLARSWSCIEYSRAHSAVNPENFMFADGYQLIRVLYDLVLSKSKCSCQN
jgi:hypothetical protein